MRIPVSSGAAGAVINSSPATRAPTADSACSGLAGATELTASNINFAPGQQIAIYQARGGAVVGKIEFNKIEAYNHGTGKITTVLPLLNNYTNSGDEVATVVTLEENTSFDNSSTYSLKAWTGLVGGINIILCSGRFRNQAGATLNGVGKGYRGGAGASTGITNQAFCGEGTVGASKAQQAANGNGGGGGKKTATGGSINTGGGGGGGHQAGAGSGSHNGGAPTGGVGGGEVGGSGFETGIFMGGGGGGGGENGDSGTAHTASGKPGGGILIVVCDEFNNEGTIDMSGTPNDPLERDSNQDGDGGPGAGGSLWVIARRVTGDGLIKGVKGLLTTGGAIGRSGAAADGRVQFDICSGNPVTDTTLNSDPAAENHIGGHSFCSSILQLV